jgi:hypothetical protein
MTGCTAFFRNAYRSSPIDSPHPARSDYRDVGGSIAAHPHDCRPGDPVKRDQRHFGLEVERKAGTNAHAGLFNCRTHRKLVCCDRGVKSCPPEPHRIPNLRPQTRNVPSFRAPPGACGLMVPPRKSTTTKFRFALTNYVAGPIVEVVPYASDARRSGRWRPLRPCCQRNELRCRNPLSLAACRNGRPRRLSFCSRPRKRPNFSKSAFRGSPRLACAVTGPCTSG